MKALTKPPEGVAQPGLDVIGPIPSGSPSAPQARRRPPKRREPGQLSIPVRRLHAAACSYGDARVAMDAYEGPRHGLEFSHLLMKWRAATVEMNSAARAFAANERGKE